VSRSSRADHEIAEAARVVTQRAIRRLGFLEWLILLGAIFLALAGGALVAWLLGEPSGFGFRPTWMVASLFLFVIPAAISLVQIRRDEAKLHLMIDKRTNKQDG